MRHLSALLISLSMLHLMLVGRDSACVSHEWNSDEAMAGMMAGMQMGAAAGAHGVVVAAAAVASSDESSAQPASGCTTPSATRCCEAMSSCRVATTVATVERSVMFEAPDSGTPFVDSTVLESILTAPEPPPPKA